MNTAQQWPSPLSRAKPIKTEGSARAFSYSILAHLLLIAMFTIGINWRTSAPGGVEVELWDSTPVVERTETPPPAPINEEAADIAINKKPVEKEPPKKEVAKEVPKPIEKVPPKKEVVKEAPKPAKVTPPQEKPKEPEKPKKAEEAKAPTPAQIKANAAAEKARADQLARLRAAAGAEGGSGGQVGSSVGGGGNAPPAYADKVRRKIKPLIVFNPESITGNPAVIVLVDLAPDGAILKRSVVTSSGIQSWDQAVLQALDRAETFPKDDNGVIPMRQMKLTFKPKD
jgi:colicin import membrane protein